MPAFSWMKCVRFLRTPPATVVWSLLVGYICNDLSNKMQPYGFGVIAFIPYMVISTTLLAIYVARFAGLYVEPTDRLREDQGPGDIETPPQIREKLTLGQGKSRTWSANPSAERVSERGIRLPISDRLVEGNIHLVSGKSSNKSKGMGKGKEKITENSNTRDLGINHLPNGSNCATASESPLANFYRMVAIVLRLLSHPLHQNMPKTGIVRDNGAGQGADLLAGSYGNGGQCVIANFSSSNSSERKRGACSVVPNGGPLVSSPNAVEDDCDALSDFPYSQPIKITIPWDQWQAISEGSNMVIVLNVEERKEAQVVKELHPIGAQTRGSLILHKKILKEELLRDIETAMKFDDKCTIQLGSVAILKKQVQDHWVPTILSIRQRPRKLWDFLIGEAPEWCVTGLNLQDTKFTAATAERKETLRVTHKKTSGKNEIVFKEPRLFPLPKIKVYIYASRLVNVEGVTLQIYSEAKEVQQAHWISGRDGLLPSPWSVIKMASLSLLGGYIRAWTVGSIPNTGPEALTCYSIVGLLFILSTWYFLSSRGDNICTKEGTTSAEWLTNDANLMVSVDDADALMEIDMELGGEDDKVSILEGPISCLMSNKCTILII